ncbi:uncharacterized protein LOC131849834 [Achroia grisella]|uniref:uncharacterized protein LOC131849834 n=1 Tax=Achroia grisella TaxID=688607 RepID=UPI0027D27440|nr:uncharacterized protein LOC131849834 [Achroia grisella]
MGKTAVRVSKRKRRAFLIQRCIEMVRKRQKKKYMKQNGTDTNENDTADVNRSDSTTSDLEKFKRFLIRTVSKQRQQHVPEDVLWEQLQNGSKCDCKLIWDRMRTLTIKRLKRLLIAADNQDNISSKARMTLTDWIMFDFILVHEDIDFTGVDLNLKSEPVCLLELFTLVQRFDVEGRSGNELASAWTAATVYYNSRGRQCSPMLLQRRWYQMKMLARDKFYNFWYAYRGTQKYLNDARTQHAPTKLQTAIVRRYPHTITMPFIPWEELIKKRFAILPDEFAVKMRTLNKASDLPKPLDENAPDLIRVEPEIEVLNIRVDSESESEYDESDLVAEANKILPTTERNNDAIIANSTLTETDSDVSKSSIYQMINVKDEVLEIKTEEIDVLTELSHCKDLEMTPITTTNDNVKWISIPGENSLKDADKSLNEGELSAADCSINEYPTGCPKEEISIDICVKSEPASTEITTESDVSKSSTSQIYNVKVEPLEIITEGTEALDKLSNCKDWAMNLIPITNDNVIDRISIPVKNSFNIGEIVKEEEQDFTVFSDIRLKSEPLSNEIHTAISEPIVMPFITNVLGNVHMETETLSNICNILMVNDALEAPGIEQPILAKQEKIVSNEIQEINLSKDTITNIDLNNSLNTTTQYSNNTPYSISDLKEDIPINVTLMDKNIKVVAHNTVLNSVARTCNEEDVHDDDDLFLNSSSKSFDSTDCKNYKTSEKMKVSISSSLFQKPRTRIYNFINLCKNPDFNTRLKKLTIGFLRSTRNRQLLKACKPITIDVNKVFEIKLINNIMYLRASTVPNTVNNIEKEFRNVGEKIKSLVPSALLSVNNLIDSTKMNMQDVSNIIRNSADPQQYPLITECVTDVPNIIYKSPKDSDNQYSNNVDARKTVSVDTQLKENCSSNSDKEDVSMKDSTLNTIKKRNVVDKSIVSWVPRFRAPVNWSRTKFTYPKKTDTLLTADALNKMLKIFSPDGPQVPVKKYKRNSKVTKVFNYQQSELQQELDDFERFLKNSGSNVTCKNENYISSKVNNFHVPLESSKSSKLNTDRYVNKSGKYCCWAREKINKPRSKSIQKHNHPVNKCSCCCKNDLDIIITKKKKSNKSSIIRSLRSHKKYKNIKNKKGVKKIISGVINKNTIDTASSKVKLSTSAMNNSPVDFPDTQVLYSVPIERLSNSNSIKTGVPNICKDSSKSTTYCSIYIDDNGKQKIQFIIDSTKNLKLLNSMNFYYGNNKVTVLGKDTECPIYLEKKQILLTDVKFPLGRTEHKQIDNVDQQKIRKDTLRGIFKTENLNTCANLSDNSISSSTRIINCNLNEQTISSEENQHGSDHSTEHVIDVKNYQFSNIDYDKSIVSNVIITSCHGDNITLEGNKPSDSVKEIFIHNPTTIDENSESKSVRIIVQRILEKNLTGKDDSSGLQNIDLSSHSNGFYCNLESSLMNGNEVDVQTAENELEQIKIVKEDSSNNEHDTKKCILSDLMEMSGILDEDASSIPVDMVQESVTVQPQNMVTDVPNTIVLDEDGSSIPIDVAQKSVTVQSQNMVTDVPNTIVLDEDGSSIPFDVAQKSVTVQSQNMVTGIPNSIVECPLYLVLSFPELNYACEKNGKFYKYDLETGQVSETNILIMKDSENSEEQQKKSETHVTNKNDDTSKNKRKQRNLRKMNKNVNVSTNISQAKPLIQIKVQSTKKKKNGRKPKEEQRKLSDTAQQRYTVKRRKKQHADDSQVGSSDDEPLAKRKLRPNNLKENTEVDIEAQSISNENSSLTSDFVNMLPSVANSMELRTAPSLSLTYDVDMSQEGCILGL